MAVVKYIVLEKKNEVYLSIEAEAGIRRDLSEYFTFEVPGFKFMPQYRNRVWDGKIRLYSYQTGQIYAGLYPYIIKWCKDNNIEVVDGSKIKDVTVDEQAVDGFIKALKIPFAVRDYQREAFIHAIKKSRCLLLSPTASGKSLIVYLITRFNLIRLKNKKQNKVLIIVPTTSLVEQLYSDFKAYGYNVDKNVHRIYSGYERETNKRIVISTWQSLYKLPKSFFEEFGCVFGDEAHLFKAKSLTSILTKLEQCKYRIGLTGTLDGTKTHKLVLEGLFGSVNRVARTEDLQKKKQLADLKIMCLVLEHSDAAKFSNRQHKYPDEIDYLVSSKARNIFIRNLLLDQQGNSLCLFQLVEKHGKELFKIVKEKADKNRKVFFVYGGTDTDIREDIRKITEKSDNAIIIASYGTFSTGINIRNLHNIVFASPSKSRIRNLQSIGRGLRLGDNKSNATLFDISDDLSYNGKSNYTLEHFKERINTYTDENFNYEIHNVKLKD